MTIGLLGAINLSPLWPSGRGQIAARITGNICWRIRSTDKVFRFEGESLVVLANNAQLTEAGMLGEQFRQEIASGHISHKE